MSNPELTGRPSPLDTKARAAARAATPTSTRHSSATAKLARGLGWFSIGLGLMEIMATRTVARRTGLLGRESLLRVHGMREVANGVGILASRKPAPQSGWMWGRVVGDALDLTTVTAAAAAARARRPGSHPVAAMVAVAGVAMLDVVCARSLQRQANAARQTTDYSNRSGIGASPEQVRGAALKTFMQPPDMQAMPQADTTVPR